MCDITEVLRAMTDSVPIWETDRFNEYIVRNKNKWLKS